MTVRLYRLVVEYPEGVGYDNPPKAWCDYWNEYDENTGMSYMNERTFSWPTRRNFLSKAAAERRAGYLREYGCTVKVIESDPVIFPELLPQI